MKFLIAAVGFLILFIPKLARAAPPTSIYFSEVAWAGSSVSTADEWIELVNVTDHDVDLSGWIITRWEITNNVGHETDMVTLGGIIHPNQYFIVGNHNSHYSFTHGESVLAHDPDSISSGMTLSNTTLQLKLYQPSPSGRLLTDTAGDGGKPLAGSANPKSTMLRRFPIGDGSNKDNWYSATTSDGFDPGVADFGSPGLPNKSLPQISNSLCTPAILYQSFSNLVNCKGIIISYDGTDILATINIAGAFSPLTIGPDGNWQLAKEFDCDSQILDLTITALSANGLSNTSTISLPCRQTSAKIVISEVYPRGTNGEEWIELHNESDVAVDLTDWALDDIPQGGSKPYTFPQGTALAHDEYRIFDKTITKIALNDAGDMAVLSDPWGKVIDQTTYPTAALGYSWTRQNERAFVWTDQSTKSSPNLLDEKPSYSFDIHISEFMPNPVGSDEEGEWIEIYNNSDKVVDLSGWKIDDEEGGSTPFTINKNTLINPKDYLVFKRPQTNLALNNDADEVRLFHPDGVLIENISYTAVAEGESYARINNQWQWTTTPTPGAENILTSVPASQPISPTETRPMEVTTAGISSPSSLSSSPSPAIQTIKLVTIKKTIPALNVSPLILIQSGPIIFKSNVPIVPFQSETKFSVQINFFYRLVWQIALVVIGLGAGVEQWLLLSSNPARLNLKGRKRAPPLARRN